MALTELRAVHIQTNKAGDLFNNENILKANLILKFTATLDACNYLRGWSLRYAKKMFCSRKKSYYNSKLKQMIYADWRKLLVSVIIFPQQN